MRLSCLFVPLFPLAARLRSEPELKGEAVAILEGNGSTARVVAATRKARKKGIEPGMTLPQARSLFPKLVARGRDRESERSAQEALLEVADSFSPRVEDAGEGTVFLDLTGHAAFSSQLSALSQISSLSPGVREGWLSAAAIALRPAAERVQYEGLGAMRRPRPQVASREASGRQRVGVRGEQESIHNSQLTIHNSSQSPELSLAREIIAAAEKASLPARVGIAGSKLSARVAASLPDSPRVVPEGEEAAFLAPLPLSKLAPALEIAETLERWGIRSIGELAKLPEGEVASRLGGLGRQLQATARGIDPRPLEPRLASPCFSEGMELEWPLVSLEPFLFVGNAALERLMQRLESQALACTRLEIGLKLDPDGYDVRAIALPAPTRDVKTLLTLVRLELEARPPGAPVEGFTFVAQPDKPRRAQLSLFGPAALSPDKLATTIARLAALLGADRVGSPRTVDGHRPERFTEVSYAPPPPPELACPPRAGRGLLAIRVLRPPVELEVITFSYPLPLGEGRGEGETSITNHKSQITNSSRLVSLKSASPDATPPISGSVRVASGPWSLEEGWWLDDPRSGRSAGSLPEGRSLALRERECSEGSGLRSSPHPGEPRAGAPADPEQARATARDYWDVELSDGGLYRIYRDRATNAWFADGVYD